MVWVVSTENSPSLPTPSALPEHTGIIRAAWCDIAWQNLCQAQEFLESTRGSVGISPPHFFAFWRYHLESAFAGAEPWKPPKPPNVTATRGAA